MGEDLSLIPEKNSIIQTTSNWVWTSLVEQVILSAFETSLRGVYKNANNWALDTFPALQAIVTFKWVDNE